VLVAGLALFGALEAGQLFLSARTADVTDVLIALMGVETGRRLVKQFDERKGAAAAAISNRHANSPGAEYPPAFNGNPAGG